MTKGGADEIAYRMKTYAAKYDIEFDFHLIIWSMQMMIEIRKNLLGNI